MNRTDFRNDLDAILEELGALTRDQALALYGYITGLRRAEGITSEDYEHYWDLLPISSDDLADADVNL